MNVAGREMVPRQEESQHADHLDEVLRGGLEVPVLHLSLPVRRLGPLQQVLAVGGEDVLGRVPLPHHGMGHLVVLHDR